MSNIDYMKLAMKLAKRGRGMTKTNPLVGCLIVKSGKIVGRGYHKYFGGPHAEVEALRDAGEKARGGRMFVTLEPCVHWGKTSPCVDAIIKSGIKSVVIGMKDPNPLVNGKGIKILKRHGIDTEVGILEDELRELNRFYIKYITTGLPYCALKLALSLDGKVADSYGNSKWITSLDSRREGWKLRCEFDAILVGVNTVIKDDPNLTSHGLGRDPVKIVIDPSLRVPLGSKLFEGGEVIIVCCEGKLKNFKKSNVNFITFKKKLNKYFNFRKIMKKIAEKNICSVLIEGGPITASEALKHKVVDELILFYSPKILGGEKSSPFPHFLTKLKNAPKLKNMKIKKIKEEILIKGCL